MIIDWHSHDIYTEQAEEFFSNIAQQYVGYPNIIYEIFNEPENRSWEEIKEYSERVIRAIRRYDDSNLIILGTPNWSQSVDIAADDPIYGYDNIVYALHFYSGTHREELRAKAQYAIERQLPLFVSECSPSMANGDGKLDTGEFRKWSRLLSENDISVVLWGIYDKGESSAMLKYGSAADGKWSAVDLTEMGIFAKRYLSEGKGSVNAVTIVGILFLLVILCVVLKAVYRSYPFMRKDMQKRAGLG